LSFFNLSLPFFISTYLLYPFLSKRSIMNKSTLVFAVVALLGITSQLNAQSKIYRVTPTGKGNGTSWANAFGDLQDALKKAKFGDQIWVAEGLYYPTTGTDRSVSFKINDGITLLGGFSGFEKVAEKRDPAKNPTILSGNIASDESDDNTYNVIYTKNVSDKTVVDGLIIVGGHADKDVQASDRRRSGGAWYNDGSKQGSSNPTIIDCIFMDNYAKDGGGLYNNGNDGEASPTLIDCVFENNICDLDGGAIYNDGRTKGKSNPLIKTCRFTDNKGNYGGAIFNNGLGGVTQPIFNNCDFSSNNAYVKGGAVFNMTDEKLVRTTMFGESTFNNNNALDHGSDDIHQYLVKGVQMAANKF
jgi:predicted outer membrane repeat protein